MDALKYTDLTLMVVSAAAAIVFVSFGLILKGRRLRDRSRLIEMTIFTRARMLWWYALAIAIILVSALAALLKLVF